MAGLAPIPGFGDTQWDEIKWARSVGMNDVPFIVADANAWRPTVAVSGDRTISLATGGGSVAGGAVYDELSSPETVQFDANTGTTDRLDVLVARWDWLAKTRTFVALKGVGTSLPTINIGPNRSLTSINRMIGDLYDGLVAVVRVRPNVGTFSSADLTDLRLWGGESLNATTENYISLQDVSEGTVISLPPIATNNVITWHERQMIRQGATWRYLGPLRIRSMADRPKIDLYLGMTVAPYDFPANVWTWSGRNWYPNNWTLSTWIGDAPAGAWARTDAGTRVLNTNSVGAFNIGLPSASQWFAAEMIVGDNVGYLGYIVPVPANYTGSNIHGQAFVTEEGNVRGQGGPNGTASNRVVRINFKAYGWSN